METTHESKSPLPESDMLQFKDIDAVDYAHPVDHIEPVGDEYRADLQEALRVIVCWSLKSNQAQHVGARMLVLANSLGVEPTSFAEIARRSDLTREAVRLMARELEDKFGLRPSNSRTDETRRRCRRRGKEVRPLGTPLF